MDRQYLTAQDAAKTLRCPYGPTQYTPLVGSQWYYDVRWRGLQIDALVKPVGDNVEGFGIAFPGKGEGKIKR